MLLSAVGMLLSIPKLLLRRIVLLVWVMIALLVLRRRRIGRSATVGIVIVTLVVMALLRRTIALMGLLAVGVVGGCRILALSLGICALSLGVLLMRRLSIRLALWRIVRWLRAIALLVLICAVVSIA